MKTIRCEHCGGEGDVEVCDSCECEVDACECDSDEVQPSRMEACPECDGEGSVEVDS